MQRPIPENEAELKGFACELAQESGRLILQYWEDNSFNVTRKGDSTPVTEADRQAEKLMRERISERFPDHGIIGEEFGAYQGDAEYVWVLDPIDGTKSFVGGVPLFTTLIGLLYKDEPVLGIIHQPVLGQLVIGDNRETLLNGERIQVAESPSLDRATVLTTSLHYKGEAYCPRSRWDAFIDQAGVVRTWGDAYGYLLVASGKAHLMVDPVLEVWDLIALLPVLRGAGATVSGWDGGDPRQSKSLVAGTPEIHAEAMRELGLAQTAAN